MMFALKAQRKVSLIKLHKHGLPKKRKQIRLILLTVCDTSDTSNLHIWGYYVLYEKLGHVKDV